MHWYALGHASWLAEVAGLRLLFDPLLDDLHHGGVFSVTPPRVVDAAALAPDFVFVSHRHPDHFDLASLARLARLDPDIVVVTPDPLVESCALRLGFRTVRRVDAETKIDLDGPRILTTPSVGVVDPEWGVMVGGDGGVVWNQVDTSLGGPAEVDTFMTRAASAFERPRGELVALALARWQPLLEVESALAMRTGFPFAAYADELSRIAAVGARAIVPSSTGARHARPFEAMNRLVYPVTHARFLRDARARMPGVQVLPFTMGARYTVAGRDVEVDERGAVAAGLVRPSAFDEAEESTEFRPLEVPPLRDPNVEGRSNDAIRTTCASWVENVLVEALARAPIEASGELRYVLEIVWPGGVDTYTIIVTRNEMGARGRLSRTTDSAWDVRCIVAGSMLCDVVEAKRSWGDLLLGGMLRGTSRAYAVDSRGMREIVLQPLFLYEAISYEESVERSLDSAVERLLAGGAS